MTLRIKDANAKVILSLTLIHFIGDFYNAFIIPLLPLFIDKFSLTLAQAGLVTGLSRFMAFVVQPPVGYIADRHPSRFFALGGPLLVVVFIPLTGITPNFWMLVLCVCLGSIGSSMFHPTAAGMVEPYAGRHFGMAMSIFGTGGTLAFAVGPLFISWLVAGYGLAATPFSMILGFGAIIFIYRTVPAPQASMLKSHGFINSIKEVFGSVWLPIVLILTVMILRAFVSQSFMTYLPVRVARLGYSLVSIGVLVSLFTVAGALSGLLAGHLSDRIGFKPVFICAHLLATPCIVAALYLPGNWIFVFCFLAGFFILATIPLGVALAQKLAPKGKSMASSLMMGLAYGTGGLLTPLTGKLADIFTIRPVLVVTAIIPVLTVVPIVYLFSKDPSAVRA
ncbi:MAG: MFS transporter [Desulfobacterales bacterium]|nr:MFS transporter [Desulfobacterales bacterium]